MLRVQDPFPQIHVDGHISAFGRRPTVVLPPAHHAAPVAVAVRLDEARRLGSEEVSLRPGLVLTGAGLPDKRRLRRTAAGWSRLWRLTRSCTAARASAAVQPTAARGRESRTLKRV